MFILPGYMVSDGLDDQVMPSDAEFATMMKPLYERFTTVPKAEQKAQEKWTFRTNSVKMMGRPIGTDAGIQGWLRGKARAEERLITAATSTPGVQPVDIDTLIRRSADKRC